MEIENVKKNLNQIVNYKGNVETYRLTACILRKGQSGLYYQAELTDTKHGKSLVICKLEDITEV